MKLSDASTIRRARLRLPLLVLVTLGGLSTLVLAAPTVPNEIMQPGTQPGEVAVFANPDNCGCHESYTQNVNPGTEPEREPNFGWRGGMMGNAGRDPLFWATLAIAEQDFIPNADPNERGGAGDLCIRCHSVGGWIGERSTPTDGSGLSPNGDTDGVECEFCHLLVHPDPATNIAGTTEVQNTPFEAYDPVTGEPYFGSGQYVLNGGGTRLGPYDEGDHAARHAAYGSDFHRSSDLCGTCHDVSNPAVGDLAWNHGSQEIMLAAGTFDGTVGGPIADKAAFNNPPYKYGIVERTYSEHVNSVFPTKLVNDFGTLPADLQNPEGSIAIAYHRAWDARSNANYEDGDPRYFTCQTCHMAASTGEGCDKNNTPTRTDLPRHDQTGAAHWITDAVQYMDDKGTLIFGGGLTQQQKDAMDAGKDRAIAMIQSAGDVTATQQGNDLVVRVTNLTGHKLISGYPEGRRMWINVEWYDGSTLIHEDGGYGGIGRFVNDLDGTSHEVQSILDLDDTYIIEVKPGLDQGWAAQLLSLGYDPNLAIEYDRVDDSVLHTLGELAGSPPGTAFHSFHFVINNVVTHDNRLPPYGFAYDTARTRNALPVPKTQFGNPGQGGTYDYWVDVPFPIPSGATSAEVHLRYQQTSWEYIQFLWKNNDGLNTFLADEGVNLMDAWLNTGMAEPVTIDEVTVPVTPAAGTPGQASRQLVHGEQMHGAWNEGTSRIDLTYTAACGSTEHTIYYGDLASVGSYNYSGATCAVGTTGTASFDPGPGSVFFLIVGNDGSVEGSYGADSTPTERPEHTGTPGCDHPQDLTGSCDP